MTRGQAMSDGDVARWILSLADPASEWVTGQVVAADGGLGLAWGMATVT